MADCQQYGVVQDNDFQRIKRHICLAMTFAVGVELLNLKI